jgi:H+/Cl- antiporter ClcA
VTEGRWTDAAVWARRSTVGFAACTAVSVGLLAVGLVTQFWWDRVRHGHTGFALWYILFVPAAGFALYARSRRKYYLRLDEAVSNAPGSLP